MINELTTKKNNQPDNYTNQVINFNYFTVIVALGIITILFIISQFNYLLFHSIVEGFSIVIACGIFMVVWNSRKFIENNFFIVIGIAYVFVSARDFFHAVSYNGIDIFPGKGANIPTQLWIAARYLQAISLLIAPAFNWPKNTSVSNYNTLFYSGNFYYPVNILPANLSKLFYRRQRINSI